MSGPDPRPAGRTPIATLDRAGGKAAGGKATFGFIALMAALGAINAFSTDVIIPALGLISDEYQLTDPNQRQWLLLALFVGVAVSQLLIGPVADSFGRRTAAAVNIGTYIAGTVIALLAPNFAMLLVGRVLQGLGSGGLRVVSLAVTRDRFAGDEMARVVSLSSAVFIVFILLAPAIGQVVIAYLDWRWLFGVLLIQASLTALWFFSIQTETLRPEHRRPLSFRGIFETFGAVLGNRFCMAYALALSLMFGAFVSYLATTQQVLGEIYGLGALLPVAFGALAVVNGLAALANARAVNRIGARALSHGALVISGAAGLIGAAAFAALWDGVPPLWLHLVWISIPVCAFATLFGNLSAIALEPMGARAGAASAVVSAFGSGAGVLVASASGAMFDGTVVPLHLTFGLAGILGYVAVRLSGKPA